MSGPLTADQAIDLLHKSPGAYTTPEKIRALAVRVNADAAGRLTVLYSGGVGKGVWSNDIIKGIPRQTLAKVVPAQGVIPNH